MTEFKLPIMNESNFNQLAEAKLGKGALKWDDLNRDKTFLLKGGALDPSEISGKKMKEYVIKKDGKLYFSQTFEPIYTEMAETLRQEKVKKELTLTIYEPMVSDIIVKLKEFPDVTVEEIALYQEGLKKLMTMAPIMKELYQKQIGASPKDRIEAVTENDRELIDRYGHPWCLSDTNPFCVALPDFKARTSTVVPEGVSCEEASDTGSPFEVIEKNDEGKLVAIPYARTYSEDLRKAATIMREAAEILGQIPREEKFATHLKDNANAFESMEPYPFNVSDASWNDALTSDSFLFIRTGPDEVGGDGVGDDCQCKARYHFNVGIKNQGVGETVSQIEPQIQRIEELFAELIDDPENYKPTEIHVQLPVFLDVIFANGDDVGGPSGTPIGQTLPNWCGSDGKGECMHGTMIYTNKTLKAYSKDLMDKYIMPLFAPNAQKYFNAEAGIESVVYHELFHNIGPRQKKKKPDSDETYGDPLVSKDGVSWRLPMEELKAQTGALFMATLFYMDAKQKFDNKEIDKVAFEKAEQNYREHMMYDLAWALRMILRASRSGPEFTSQSPYSRLAAVQIGFLADQGAIKYNTKTKQWSVDFNKLPDAITLLMKKVGQLYAASNVEDIETIFLYYMQGDGVKQLHRDRIVEVAGDMPSVLFDYRIKGL